MVVQLTYADHLDFYRRGPYSQYLVEHHSTGSAPIGLFKASQPAGHFPDPAFPNLLLYVANKGTREASFDWGAGKWKGRWLAGDLTLVPANAASDVELAERHEFLALSIPLSGVDHILADRAPDLLSNLAPLHASPFRNTFATLLCNQIWHEAASGSPHGSLFADGALTSLLATLGNLSDRQAANERNLCLPQTALARVHDYIQVNLAKDLTVAELAAIAGFSPAHFSRLFASATGLTPYQFVLNRRLDEAKTLLSCTVMAITDVAAATGFSSQSHLTDQFRRRFGLSPGALTRLRSKSEP